MKWIYDLSYQQLEKEIVEAGIKKFAANQVFQWLYGKIVPDIACWSNVSKVNREILSGKYHTSLNTIEDVRTDSMGTKKFLFRLADKRCIEAVSIKEKGHYTFCISTQVGCALACRFCATGTMGFIRNLTSGEILSQILTLKKDLEHQPPEKKSQREEEPHHIGTDAQAANVPYTGKLNLVFMGMGEPLLNYRKLALALEIITAENGISISPRNITISTAGILEKIMQFEKDFPRIKISFSLNASDGLSREQVMPISIKEPLEDILEYFRSTGKIRKHRVTFEYVMLKGVNDSPGDARKIAKLLRGIPCKINLIPFNPHPSARYGTPTVKAVEAFDQHLHSAGYTVIVRWSKGKDIKSACGQLAGDNDLLKSTTGSDVDTDSNHSDTGRSDREKEK
ncbi:MAG: 23S rRNA (adenine(2503)-C(2))-methyltransferase RlmN [bacterium]|nr:23S rRNA (adenine(2503)-C(2))-methyltransferase RlmN [bacterium]